MEIMLKKWESTNLELLVKYANNQNISNYMTDAFPFPYTNEDGIKYIERAMTDNPTKLFAIQHENETVGSIGIFPESDIYRKNAAIAYWVAEPFWGKGIGSRAIQLMVEYAFKTFDISRIYAKPFSNNIASHCVLEKAGFKLEAILRQTVIKKGEFLDEHVYGIRKEEF